MVFRPAWVMPVEWKCRSCNNVFASRDRPDSCPLCHRRTNIEIFNDDMRFYLTEMD